MQTIENKKIQELGIPNRWCLHSYYTLCPYAPDGSGRLLIAGADLDKDKAEVFVLDSNGAILNRFGNIPTSPSFWHTGLWQSWSRDGQQIYFQSGSQQKPQSTRIHLQTGKHVVIDGDIEGMPPLGEPALSCSHGMLYAAGYGSNRYQPERAPIPFQNRTKHGISQLSFEHPEHNKLKLSTQQILDQHPQRERILQADEAIKERLGSHEGLTLMTYCVRWNRAGDRLLFFFGNHCVVSERNEPKITSIFTANRDLEDLQLAVDLSFERRGVHWGWQADNKHLIGYGPSPDDPNKLCLAEVLYDGTGYRKISDHQSGGHPSTSPRNSDLIVTDECTPSGGNVVFISKQTGEIIERIALPKFIGDVEPAGRNPQRICHHPVFNHDGTRVLSNTLPNRYSSLVEIEPPL
ncbi:hypothetical protein QEH59_09460 [Coraliomargarita sp. SDUM461004]|uniref:Translocation protein TolB n=2 Tax=Thalassobacterium sedimentorum TaxID=3041258 RepID=A0ABU1AIQ2_9BACT|nr:hypothetical protein [Coraliomargarita sp. SDUM461004]